MSKRMVSCRLDLSTIRWLDREISKSCFASYNHSIKQGLKLLRKLHKCTIKFKKANSIKTQETEENV